MDRPARFAEVDLLKAVGALAVLLIHTVRSPFEAAASPPELWIGQLTRFAVPGFLAASGFLYATRETVTWETTRGRLVRLALPYLLFSAVAQALRHLQGTTVWGTGSGDLWIDLLFGASLGPYYYVFIAALLVATAFMSADSLAEFSSVARIVAPFFLLYQLVMFIDFGYRLNDLLLRRDEDNANLLCIGNDSGNLYKKWMLFTTIVTYIGIFVGFGFMYSVFPSQVSYFDEPTEQDVTLACSFNTGITTVTLLFVLLNTGVGGTGFSDGNWVVPNGRLTVRAIAAVEALKANITAALGGEYSFHTMLWHQVRKRIFCAILYYK